MMVKLVKVVGVFIVFNIVFISVDAILTNRPSNTLGKFKVPTKFTCCSNVSAVLWKHQKFNNGGLFRKICEHTKCGDPQYMIDNSSSGCFHLIINSTSEDDSGLYQCSDGTGDIAGAYFIINDLDCSHSSGISEYQDDPMEGDSVKFECAVLWKGKLPFAIQWISTEEKSIRSQEIISEVKDIYQTSISVNVTRNILPSYMCKLGLLDEGIMDGRVDRKLPTISWSSFRKFVMFPASKVRTNCPGKSCDKVIDDSLNCSADGYPNPDINWLDWDNNTVSFEKQLKLTSFGHHEYTCIAKNIIRGKRHEISIRVDLRVIQYIKESNSESKNASQIPLILGLFSALIIFIAVIILVTVYCFVKRVPVTTNMTSQTMPQKSPMNAPVGLHNTGSRNEDECLLRSQIQDFGVESRMPSQELTMNMHEVGLDPIGEDRCGSGPIDRAENNSGIQLKRKPANTLYAPVDTGPKPDESIPLMTGIPVSSSNPHLPTEHNSSDEGDSDTNDELDTVLAITNSRV